MKLLDLQALMTFPLHLTLLKYVSDILTGWNHSLLHHRSYNHCLGHVIWNPANVITVGQCKRSNVITFECKYICPSLGLLGCNFANVITLRLVSEMLRSLEEYYLHGMLCVNIKIIFTGFPTHSATYLTQIMGHLLFTRNKLTKIFF